MPSEASSVVTAFSDGRVAPPDDPFSVLDTIRRRQGEYLEAWGWAPAQTESEILFSRPGVHVRSYSPSGGGPLVLVVPAPIKRAYIWDLQSSRSPIRLLCDAGFAVHLVEWLDPEPDQQGPGLSETVDTLLQAAVEAVRSTTERNPVLLGHSLGGTLAALLTALRPELVAGLALLEAPLRLGADAGAFAPVVALAPDTSWVKAAFGNVPGSFISVASASAAPATFHFERYLDLFSSLGQGSFQTHMRVERWSLDEMALPGQLFEDVVEQLYRRDEFMRGELVLGGRRVGPETVECPLLLVVNPGSRVIPPRSVVPFHEAAASRRKTLVQYRGDQGVALQHVGVLVGSNAHARVWPQIVRWLRRLPP